MTLISPILVLLLSTTADSESVRFEAPSRPHHLGAATLVVVFDGLETQEGCGNDPVENCSEAFVGQVLPHPGTPELQAEIVAEMRHVLAPFGVTVTDQRPPSGPYEMVVFGEWEGESPLFSAVHPGPPDCGDAGGGVTSFVVDVNGFPWTQAHGALWAWGIGHGLEPTDARDDIMRIGTTLPERAFTDGCVSVYDPVDGVAWPGECAETHQMYCDANEQNPHQELLALLGPGTADTTAPTVTIVAPAEGEVIDGNLDIVYGLDDDQSPMLFIVSLTVTSNALAEPIEMTNIYAGPREVTTALNDLPVGAYTLTIETVDDADNTGSSEVSFTVEQGGTPGTTGGEDSAGDETGADDTSSTSGDTDGTSSDTDGTPGDTDGTSSGARADSGGSGCSVRDTGEPLSFSALLAMFGLAIRRRRGS